MTKDELMQLTIKQLTEYFYAHSECFNLESPTFISSSAVAQNPTIIFQSQINPINASRSMTLAYDPLLKTMTCQIFFRQIAHANATNPDATICISIEYKWFSKSYWMYRKLHKQVAEKLAIQKHNEYLDKLHSVFPGSYDDYIFGK